MGLRHMVFNTGRFMRLNQTVKYIVVVLLLICTQAAHALRCDRHLISEGDFAFEVLHHCGEPLQKRSWQEYPRQRLYDDTLGAYRYEYLGKPVLMQEWIYNFGPRRLMRRLTFRASELIKIETLDYGY